MYLLPVELNCSTGKTTRSIDLPEACSFEKLTSVPLPHHDVYQNVLMR